MTDFTDRFGWIASAMARLPTDAVLDGEVVVFHPDGHFDFDALAGRGARKATLIAFDLPFFNGRDIRRGPIEKRRAALAKPGRTAVHLEGRV